MMRTLKVVKTTVRSEMCVTTFNNANSINSPAVNSKCTLKFLSMDSRRFKLSNDVRWILIECQ